MNKLHIGCGNTHLDGYLNVDLHSRKADEHVDLNEPLPYADERFEEIVGMHIFEHLDPTKMDSIIKSWNRVLKPGGTILLEMPDFDALCKSYLADRDREMTLEWIFGNQRDPGQQHRWGWNQKRLTKLFHRHGFYVSFEDPKDYHSKEGPCLRIVATKPLS